MEVPLSGASAAATVEVDSASQASEPASQASDEEDAPSTDIYFVSSPKPPSPQGACGRSHLLLSRVIALGGRGAAPSWLWGDLSRDEALCLRQAGDPWEFLILLGVGSVRDGGAWGPSE